LSALVEYKAKDGVAHVTLNRPEKRNALSAELIAAFRAALDRAAADEPGKVILLRGAGPDFCAGLDLALLTKEGGPLDHIREAQAIADLFLAMRRNPRPIVAAVHGRALGGGCGVAMASDLVLASESAQFRYTEINLGFVAAIVSALLRRSVGEKHAFELVSMAEPVSTAEAHRIGMVNRVFTDADFERNVEEYVEALAAKSASALALTKSLMHHMDGMTLESAFQAGVYVNALARGTPDAIRGIEQFVQRKK
jgi:methylglutaconyl-CoA hydratase